jgi:hypothetical protein
MVDPGNMKRWHNDNCNYKWTLILF